MTDRDRDALIESTVGAWRARDEHGRVGAADGWRDLSADDRETAFELQRATRVVERARDSDGLSGTVRAVLERIRR